MRHKQPAPRRKQVHQEPHDEAAVCDDEHGEAEQQQQAHQQQQTSWGSEPVPEYHYEVCDEIKVSTQPQHAPVGAVADFIVATKAAGQPPAGAAPAAVTVQLFDKQHVRWQPRPKQVLLFSWRCPGEDEFGPKHEVCCELPNLCANILQLLQQGYLSVSVQQLPNQPSNQQQQQDSLQHPHLPQVLQPVQYATLTANSDYVADFECDVLMVPEQADVQAGLNRCSTLAAAAARAAGGPTASLAQQSHALLEAVAPRLPAQHVSLMAAATAPDLLQRQHRQAQQQQQRQEEACTSMGSSEQPVLISDDEPPKASAALTLWRVQLCLTELAMSPVSTNNSSQQQQQQQQVDLRSVFGWLAPHWSCSHSDSSSQHRAEFDAAQVYRVIKPSGQEVQLQGTPPGLEPQLRPYQRRAVAWMLGLELGQHASAAAAAQAAAAAVAQAGSSYSGSVQQLLAGLLKPYSERLSVLLLPPAQTASSSGGHPGGAAAGQGGAGARLGLRQLFLHPVLGRLCTEAPEVHPVVPGGVLADEMGLGKTVELLSLIMSHRFKPSAVSPQQEQQHTGPLPVNQSDPQLSRCSSSGGLSSGKCCSRCGESCAARYSKEGKIREETPSFDSDDDTIMAEDDDTDGYVPQVSRKKGGKQQAGRGTKRSARKQQLPPLPPHGAGHHGTKRQRVASRRLQDSQQDSQHEQESWAGSSTRASHGAAAAASGAGADGLLCSLCMREIALQEVEQDCGTTLIVVPANILVQWVDELQRHTLPGSLSIKVYSGQPQAAAPAATGSRSRSRSSSPAATNVRGAAAATAASGKAAASNEVVTAAQLAAADIVLTTYDIIRREVALQPQTEGVPERSLRHRKRYAVVPTPLSRLSFWRLVLDEAQLAGGTSKAAEMAQHIRARHRWAVTGTPISHGGRSDILGLLKFLQVPHIPADVGGLLCLLCPSTGGLMWRTAKADVSCEMGIPPQHHHTTLLRLSAIERHWYNRSHQECAAKARKVLQDALEDYICRRDAPRGRSSSSGGSNDSAIAAAKAAAKRVAAAVIAAGGDGRQLDASAAELLDFELGPAQLKKLLLPLLRLRQACCHPQVGASGIRAVISSHNSSKPLTMDQILTVLISRARVDAEEAQRQLAGALNGLAALLWLVKQHPEAVAAYREVLGLSEASKGDVRLDNFQLLHTLHNLAELLAELARKHKTHQAHPSLTASAAAAEGAAEAAAGTAAADESEPYGPGVPQTLRDDKLAAEAGAIREQYLAQRQAELATAYQAFVKAAKDALPAGLRRRKHTHHPAAAAAAAAWSSQRGAAAAGEDQFLDELMPVGDDADLIISADDDVNQAGDESAEGADGAGGGTSVGEGWYISVIDALKEAGADEEVAEAIREKLQESDIYKTEVNKNATSLANRFKTLGGLKLLLSQEMTAINKHQATCLDTLRQLQAEVGGPEGPDELVIEQAGQCGRCRSEMGVLGRVCRHCKLDEGMRTWEARLFQLSTKALAAGTQLDASAAAQQAQAAAYRRVVGRGGLDEEAAEGITGSSSGTAAAGGIGGVIGPSAGAGARRADAAVSEAQVVRHPSEAERVLRLLQQQIGKLGMSSYLPGVQEAAKQHLEQLDGSRKMFVAANSLSIAQRQLLYAHDELSMALLRITTRREGEQVTAHEALYKLTRAEQVLKMEELTLDKAVAAGDLRRALGTLNYLKTIAGARTRVAAAAAARAAGLDSKTAASNQQQQSQQGQQQQQQKPEDPRAAAAAAALQRAAAGASSNEDAAAGGASGSTPNQLQQQQTASDAAAGGAEEFSNQGAAGTAADDKCPICFCPVQAAAAVLPCGHVLCCDCADSLVERIPAGTAAAHRYINCPNCRAHTHVSDVAYVNSEQSSKHAYVSTSSTMAAAGTTPAAAADAAAAAAAAAEYPFKGEQQLVLAGSYGTKIEAVVRRVLFVLQQDPTSKVLVFSSWGDVLAIVSHALADNGVRHVFAKDRKGLLQALEKFKGCQVSSAELGTGRAAAAAAGAAAGGVSAEGKGGPAASSSGSGTSSSTRVSALAADSDGAIQQDSGLQQQQQQQESEEELQGLDCMDVDADSLDAAGDVDTPQQQQQPNSAVTLGGSAAGCSPIGQLTAAAAGPRVLLLLVSQGGLGLNLTEAQHVVLLEPLLDPALDVQAVGRVSRFGQTRDTHVHRFIVQDTVEENVARLSRERAAAMDMTAAVPVKGGTGGAAETAQLSVRDVAALLCSKWREGTRE